MRMPSWLQRLLRRPAKSTLEKLEEIEADIISLESMRTSSIDNEKRFVFRLLLYSFILFGILFVFVYYYYWPSTQTGKAILWTSLLIYPSIVSGLKWGFHSFFLRSILKADERLKSLREDKQRLLEEVMEHETFNKAQQILKRFDPLMFARLTAIERSPTETPMNSKYPDHTRSVMACKPTRSGDGDNCPVSTRAIFPSTQAKDLNGVDSRTPIRQLSRGQPRLLRPILPRERSVVDKLLDALVGDGPDKRYALICNECASHNGMALKEEFEFLAFRCCYCSHFNPPRRTRLKTPIPPNVATHSPKSTASVPITESPSSAGSSRCATPIVVDPTERSPSPVSAKPSLVQEVAEPVDGSPSDQTVSLESSCT